MKPGWATTRRRAQRDSISRHSLLPGWALLAALATLTVLMGCANPPPPATPDIPARVAAAVQPALPTPTLVPTPTPTPDLPATALN